MKLEGKLITLDDNKKYAVIEVITYNNRLFAYLVNINDELDSIFKEIIIKDNDLYVDDIDKKIFKDKLLNLFINKISNQ